MENFEELAELVKRQQNIKRHAELVEKITVSESGKFFGFARTDGGKVDFFSLAKILTPEKMSQISLQFIGLIQVELHKANEAAKDEIRRYKL